MAATTWIPDLSTNRHKTNWLLTNGQVIESPNVETTSSERRFRVAGTTVTGYRKDINSMIWQAVQASASAAGTKPWICLGDTKASDNPLNAEPHMGEAKLHFLVEHSRATRLQWRFRHPSMPVDAILTATMGPAATYGVAASKIQVQVSMTYPSTDPRHAWTANPVQVNSPEYEFSWDGIERYGAEGQTLESWRNRTKPEVLTALPFGSHTFDSEREGIKALARICRMVDDLAGVHIPDLRDPEKPGLLELGLHGTNVTATFMQSLSDYLDSVPVVTKVFESWQEIVKTFRSVGIVVGDIKKSDLYQLMTHQNKPVMVNIGPTAEEKGSTVINNHSVTFDLATGTIAVVCSGNVHGDEVATEYEAAKIRATLTGHTDELLAYAQEYAARRAAGKAKEIVAERRAADKKNPF